MKFKIKTSMSFSYLYLKAHSLAIIILKPKYLIIFLLFYITYLEVSIVIIFSHHKIP